MSVGQPDQGGSEERRNAWMVAVAVLGIVIGVAAVFAFRDGESDARSPAPPKPPTVIVQKRGFSTTTSAAGETWITYGLVLVNRSRRTVARGVFVKVALTDSSGSPLVTDRQTLTAIPASGTFYVGGETQTTVPASVVARLRVRISVRSGQTKRLALPPVTHTSLTKDQTEGWRVSAVMTNPYKKSIFGYDGTACAVVFDSHGIILGGDCEDIGEAAQNDEIAPGATVGLEVFNPDFANVTAQAASGGISVDPGSALG